MNRSLTAALVALALALAGCGPSRQNVVVVGSKNFPEQLILGELIAQQIEARAHLKVERRFYLAGTYICQQAMLAGRIDVYPEYTGTALTAILKEPPLKDPGAVFQKVKDQYEQKFHFAVLPSFGFNDTFALQIRGADARRLHLTTISQAAKYTPQWRAGFGYEFMERPDGYKGLVAAYGLKFAKPPLIMDLGLLDRALVNKQIDLAAGNSTDGLIPVLDLAVLEDDKHYFPPYYAVSIVREEALARHPQLRAVLAELAGKVSDQDMRALNYAVDGQHRSVTDVVREFRQKKGLD
ncbi:MAG TPA: glycine betaine ABC transporter substrate-binding protein [Terriglobales bacterium]|jgi:osmoprotectant transport system substrate-binding protein|nr:glycine betaine ABC transporter substrate-binding protein [Terriglobales bacterium]